MTEESVTGNSVKL